jgi:hypothetical protein
MKNILALAALFVVSTVVATPVRIGAAGELGMPLRLELTVNVCRPGGMVRRIRTIHFMQIH